MVLRFSLFIFVPAFIWIFVLYFGSDATGKAYHLGLSTSGVEVVSFQDLEHALPQPEAHQARPDPVVIL